MSCRVAETKIRIAEKKLKKIEKKFAEKKKVLILHHDKKQCGSSSVGRAQPCQGWGRGSESRFPLRKETL